MNDLGWESILQSVRPQMEAMHQAREVALRESRSLVQLCSKCIRNVHRHQFEEAAALLDEAKTTAARARAGLQSYPELLYAGYVQDSEKELVEAAALLSMVHGASYLGPAELKVSLASFLNGMGEAASEVRRYLLDEMRKGRLDEAEALLSRMEAIYDDLITIDYPDSLTGGLRRTCDALRAVLERTRSDLTITRSQQELLDALNAPPKGPEVVI